MLMLGNGDRRKLLPRNKKSPATAGLSGERLAIRDSR